MKTTIRTAVPLLANLLLALQNRHQQLPAGPHRSTVELVEGNVRPTFLEEAPIEVRSIWQREAYLR